MNYWALFPYFSLAAVLGFWFGMETARSTIARECDKLGAFLVGDKVYECRRKE